MADQYQQVVDIQRRAAASRRQRQDAAEDLVQRIQNLREELIGKASHLHELSMELRTKSRRSLADEGSSHFIMFANAHIRLAGALTQGVRRTGSTDRVLTAGQVDRDEARRRDEMDRQRQLDRTQKKTVDKLTLTSNGAFDEVYGDLVDKGKTDA